MGLVFPPSEIDLREVDAADRIVVGRLVVDPAVGQVDGGSPLRGARDVGRVALRVVDADGDVEAVEQVEALQHRSEGCGALRRRGKRRRARNAKAASHRPECPEIPNCCRWGAA